MKRFKNIDPFTTIIPFVIILFFCIMFVVRPEQSTGVLGAVRGFLGDELGSYYLVIGLGVFLTSLYMAFSKYGDIVLGKKGEKPRYSFFTWGSMMFTSGLAADILFYSLCEWVLYANEPHISELGSIQDWASAIPLFHWGPIPWSFYAALAASFGFMLHVRGCRKQKYSEACRPLLGALTDKAPGKLIDIIAVFALIAGTATTFSLATPLMGKAISELFGINDSKWLTIVILLITCFVYTFTVLKGMKGVKYLAHICMYVFFALLAYVFFLGGEGIYIFETGFTALGNLAQNFIQLSTYTDALCVAIKAMNVDPVERNILVTHQFVTGAARCDSEELSVGGTDNVDVSVFEPFDYVALGHIPMPMPHGDIGLCAQIIQPEELVVNQGFQRAYIDATHGSRRVLGKQGDDGEEGRFGFARGGGGGEQQILVGVEDDICRRYLNGPEVLPPIAVDIILNKRGIPFKNTHRLPLTAQIPQTGRRWLRHSPGPWQRRRCPSPRGCGP